MDGYSVDNLAPADPSNVSFSTFTYTSTLTWDEPMDEDYAYTEIKRNGEVVASGSNFNQFVDEAMQPGEVYVYEIFHVDDNGNESRDVSRNANAPEWYFAFTSQAENISNSTFYFASNDSASMEYDSAYDLPAAPAPPGEGIRMISYNSEWGNILGDEYAYISVDNVDDTYFYRYVDVEIHSDINDTITVQVEPFGNYTELDYIGISVDDDSLVAIDYESSFDIPVSDTAITHLTIVAGNPDGSDGFLNVVGMHGQSRRQKYLFDDS